MIIPLDKLLLYNKNRYVLTRAAMETVDRIGNIESYPEDGWKIVPNILKLVLDDTIKYELHDPDEVDPIVEESTEEETKVEAKTETEVEAKVEVKTETEVEAKTETEEETEVEAKTETEEETKVESDGTAESE
jgi:hypothetical protein